MLIESMVFDCFQLLFHVCMPTNTPVEHGLFYSGGRRRTRGKGDGFSPHFSSEWQDTALVFYTNRCDRCPASVRRRRHSTDALCYFAEQEMHFV